MNIIGDVKNKTCIIVDDIIDSGGTIVNAVDALKKNGANEVYVFITHAVLSGDAVKKIKIQKIKKLIITEVKRLQKELRQQQKKVMRQKKMIKPRTGHLIKNLRKKIC